MLEVRALSRRFGDNQALSDVSFSVPAGEVVGFLGPNGAGKSTTMRIIMGVVEADAGEVRFDGQPLGSAARATFGYMPEERGLYPGMQLRAHLVYLARLHGVERGWAEASTDYWLSRLSLFDRATTRIGELSHGNQQRAQLAAALVHDPGVLVLDEPFSGLDPIGVDVLTGVLRDRAAAGGTVLLSSHQLDLVEDLCRSVVMLHAGNVVLDGNVRALRRDAPYRVARVAVPGADSAWTASLDGVELVAIDGDTVVLRLPAQVDPAAVYAAADTAGRVEEFCVEPPALSSLFHQAVSAEAVV